MPNESPKMPSAFERRKAESQYWFNKSSDLHASAAAVWMSADEEIASKIIRDCELAEGFSMAIAVGPVFSMLCGMAMELILKALSVERGEPADESSHDLLRLLKSAGVSYTPTEQRLLKLLSHDIVWAGRYPAPKKESQLTDYSNLVRTALFERVPLGTTSALRRNNALEWHSFNDLWRKATHEYFRIKD